MHKLLLGDVQKVLQGARDLQAAAPATAGRGWDATADAGAIDAMKAAWTRMRAAWEGSEGVLAPLFGELDEVLDGRYEAFLTPLAPTGDTNLFDGEGVTGMHAIERILFAPTTPASVVQQEAQLAGYAPAAWPATAEQAATFKNGLCARLITDAQTLVDAWRPRAIDLPGVFEGITALMSEQEEKVSLAAEHIEESRYAQRTMGDLRDNLAGTRAVYGLFVPWLNAKDNGISIDDGVQNAFDRLAQTYSLVVGDAIPPPPSEWNSMVPTADDQRSEFGMLYLAVVQEVDPSRTGSAVFGMNRVARMLALPEFVKTPE